MNVTDNSSIDITMSSFAHSTISVDESSLNLNSNVQFSKLDISDIVRSPTPDDTSKLSVTLERHEEELLQQGERPLSNGSTVTSQTLEDCQTSELTITVNDDTTIQEDDVGIVMDTLEVDESATEEAEDMLLAAYEDNALMEESKAALQAAENAESCQQDMSCSILDAESEYFQNAIIELGRRLWPSTPTEQQYTKGCLWSPDGTCLLVPVHMNGMHVVELPTDLYSVSCVSPTSQRAVSALHSAVHVKEGGTVYDCAWYPYMQSSAPETCCWLATRQHEPIHMWDAFTGELRCSYRGYDDVDEVECAISVAFSHDGQKVFGGYKKSIKMFDTNVPGRDCYRLAVKQAVSCFALTSQNDQTVTCGSWNGYIQHYDMRAPKLGALFTLGGHNGGITWLKYAASGEADWLLYSGARKDNKILLWDMRNYTEPVREFQRTVRTNQRIYFDLSPQQQWLVSGDTGGTLRFWNLLDKEQQGSLPLHADCCNGVNFHPTLPILATTSGQFHFVDVTQGDEALAPVAVEVEEKIIDYENSLLLLWCGRNVA